MNHCTLMAEIVQAPQLRYTSDNQTPVVDFIIKIPGLRSEDPPAQLKAVGWGNLAQDIQAQYHAGDRVVVEGRLSMKTMERPEGFKEKQAEITAQRVYRISDLQTLPLAEAGVMGDLSSQPTPTGNANSAATPANSPTSKPEPEPDYDEIPF